MIQSLIPMSVLKPLFFLPCLLFSLALGQTYLATYTADVGNPGGLNLELDPETTGWTSVLPAGAGANAWSTTQTVPFPVDYFGAGYTDFLVSYHGVLTFTTAPVPALPGANAALPTASLPPLSIAAFWDAFTDTPPMGPDDQVLTKTFGVAPNRQFWVKWTSVEYGDPAGASNSTFAIVFDEASGDIHLVDMASDNAANSRVTIGLQNSPTCAAAYGDASQALNGNSPAYGDNDVYTFSAETLDGTYTVGGANPDFLTLGNAAAALGCGIGGPVQLDLRDGTYAEQLRLPSIPGASASDSVLIQSESGDSSAVLLDWPPSQGSNYVLYLDGTDHLTLRGLTLQRSGTGSKADSRLLWLDNDTDSCRITRCRFVGSDTASHENRELIYLANDDAIGLEITENALLYGDQGVFLQASFLYTTTGVRIADNQFTDQHHRALSLQYLVAPTLQGNAISSNSASASYRAINLLTGRNAFTLTNHQITTPTYGLYVMGNALVAPGHPQVANNFITGGSQAAIFLENADSLDLYHNTLVVNDIFNPALQVANNAAGHHLINNLLVNQGFGTLLRLGANAATAVFATCDHNNWYSEGTTHFEQSSTFYADLCAWQSATGLDGQSQNKSPLFQTAGSYDAASPFLQVGTPLPSVGTDLLGQARSLSAPSMGAYEISAPTGPPLAGTYVIGACQDYADFSEAALALATFGVSDTVVFDVESGTYAEQVRFTGANGASGANPVIFRAQSGDSADVWLSWPSSASAADNYTLQLDGVDHLQFEDLSLRRSGSQPYGAVVALRGDADSLTLARVHLVGGDGLGSDASLILAQGADADSLTLTDSRLSGGAYGLYLDGLSLADPQQGHLIRDNVVTGQTVGGIWLRHQRADTLHGNQIALGVNGDGLHLQASQGGHQLTANRIDLSSGGRALVLTDVGGTLGSEVLVANQRLSVDGNGVNRTGLAVNGSSDYVQVYHNSALVSGDALSNRYAYYTNATGANHTLRNNLFVNTASGFAIFCTNAVGLGDSDYNGLYNNLGALAYFDGAGYADLAAWQAATGGDANSLSVDPLFDGGGDLQVAAVELNGAGVPLTEVPRDYQDEVRDLSAPDLGADEFTPQIYTLSTDVCVSAGDIVSTGSGQWQYIYANRQLVAALNDQGNTLGTVSTELYLHSGTVRQVPGSSRYLDRNWSVQTTGAISSGNVLLRLYYLDSELAALIAADPTVTAAGDLGSTRYSGANQNCDFADNQAGNSYYTFYPAPDVADGLVYGGDHYAEVPVESFSEFYLTGQGIVLPVEGLNLVAEQAGTGVKLHWQVARGENVSHFEVARAEGNGDFAVIGQVDAPARLSQAAFAFADEQALALGASTLRYRLRVVDLDGQAQLSPTVQVHLTAPQASLRLFPNPSPGPCRLRFQAAASGPVQVRVSDAMGRVVYQRQVPAAPSVQLDLPAQAWPAGIYGVELRQGGQRWRQALIRR